jgi:hypothetical protein
MRSRALMSVIPKSSRSQIACAAANPQSIASQHASSWPSTETVCSRRCDRPAQRPFRPRIACTLPSPASYPVQVILPGSSRWHDSSPFVHNCDCLHTLHAVREAQCGQRLVVISFAR